MARPKNYNEDAVLTAAMLCFWRRGYGATSMKDLEAATGLTPSSLYNSFGSKDGLFLQVLTYYFDNVVRRRVCRYLENSDPVQGIERFIRDCFERDTGMPGMACLLTNTAAELGPHEEKVRRHVARCMKFVEDSIRAAIERGQREGCIPVHKNAEVLARHLALLLNGMLVASKVVPEVDTQWITLAMEPVCAALR